MHKSILNTWLAALLFIGVTASATASYHDKDDVAASYRQLQQTIVPGSAVVFDIIDINVGDGIERLPSHSVFEVEKAGDYLIKFGSALVSTKGAVCLSLVLTRGSFQTTIANLNIPGSNGIILSLEQEDTLQVVLQGPIIESNVTLENPYINFTRVGVEKRVFSR